MNVPSDISLGDVVQRLREVVKAICGSTKQENKYFLIVDSQTCLILGGSH